MHLRRSVHRFPMLLVGLNRPTETEDCLFLNVYAPANASSLPVLVWIRGGGYGAGNGREDLSPIINANHNHFVGVAIQYRVRIQDFEEQNQQLLLFQ